MPLVGQKLKKKPGYIHAKWAPGKTIYNWLVVSTHLKNISQIGSFPQVGVKINNI